jgi:hypothetical protein
MTCGLWLITLVLVLGTIYVVASGNWRGQPQVLWPLLVMTGAWVLAAAYEIWFEGFYDPKGKFDIRVDLLLLGAALVMITSICTAWIFVSLFVSARAAKRGPR